MVICFGMPNDPLVPFPQSTLDRLSEAHWQLHQMEEYFHLADPFRWALNGFLRTIKEVPQLLLMEFQNHSGFPDWYRPRKEQLANDPLLALLFKSRDVIVHRKMLMPSSTGYLGITRGRAIKVGLGVPFDPDEDSDAVMKRLTTVAREMGDIMGFFHPDDEDTAPCIDRTWRLPEFPDDDLVDLSAKAWHRVAAEVADSIEHVVGTRPQIKLDCLHGSERVRLRMYDRAELAKYVYGPGSKAHSGAYSPAAMIASAKKGPPPAETR